VKLRMKRVITYPEFGYSFVGPIGVMSVYMRYVPPRREHQHDFTLLYVLFLSVRAVVAADPVQFCQAIDP